MILDLVVRREEVGQRRRVRQNWVVKEVGAVCIDTDGESVGFLIGIEKRFEWAEENHSWTGKTNDLAMGEGWEDERNDGCFDRRGANKARTTGISRAPSGGRKGSKHRKNSRSRGTAEVNTENNDP